MIRDSTITHGFHPLCGKEVLVRIVNLNSHFTKTALPSTGSEQFLTYRAYRPSLILLKKQFVLQWGWREWGFCRSSKGPGGAAGAEGPGGEGAEDRPAGPGPRVCPGNSAHALCDLS